MALTETGQALEEARRLLLELNNTQLQEMINEQEATRYQRAVEAAQQIQNRGKPPSLEPSPPAGASRTEPSLEFLVSQEMKRLEAVDIAKRDAKRAELALQEHRLDELARTTDIRGKVAPELAREALGPMDDRGERHRGGRPSREFNHQEERHPGLDEQRITAERDLLRAEQEAKGPVMATSTPERARTPDEERIYQAVLDEQRRRREELDKQQERGSPAREL